MPPSLSSRRRLSGNLADAQIRRPRASALLSGENRDLALTRKLTSERPSLLPSPPKGGEGLFSPTANRQTTNFRLRTAAIAQPPSIPRTALRASGDPGPSSSLRRRSRPSHHGYHWAPHQAV